MSKNLFDCPLPEGDLLSNYESQVSLTLLSAMVVGNGAVFFVGTRRVVRRGNGCADGQYLHLQNACRSNKRIRSGRTSTTGSRRPVRNRVYPRRSVDDGRP